MENKKLIIVGDYQLTQVSNDPTRLVTETTSTLIDLILTNKAENISYAGVLHLSISDHSLVYAVRKCELPKSRPSIKEVRDYKYFSDSVSR